jgi:hypothetical protein
MGVLNQSSDQYQCACCDKKISALDMWHCGEAKMEGPDSLCFSCFLDACRAIANSAILRAGTIVCGKEKSK